MQLRLPGLLQPRRASSTSPSALFHRIDRHESELDLLQWNSILAACSRHGRFLEALSLSRRMILHSPPDAQTLAITAKAAGELRDLISGKNTHSRALRLGFTADAILLNSLIAMYLRCGERIDAGRMFFAMQEKTVCSWNLMISSSSEASAWDLLFRMIQEGFQPDGFTVSAVLPVSDFARGREIHGFALRRGLGLGSEHDSFVGSCLVDMYSKNGSSKLGRFVFDGIISKNVVVWTSMISGYAQSGESAEAIAIFRKMMSRSREICNRVTLLSVLPAVGSLARLSSGKQIHGVAIRAGSSSETSLNNALIDMYAKCGNLDSARRIFELKNWRKDQISWSSMIFSCGLHGRGEEAISLFKTMIERGIGTNRIAWMGILSACGRCGLIEEGLRIYDSLIDDPSAEISSCVVDMLCRGGELRRALEFIERTPLANSSSSWGTLLEFSVSLGDAKTRDLACDRLLRLEVENPSTLAAIANVLASSQKWEAAASLRKTMRARALTKSTGRSWISVNDLY
ncbi:pentatricopeptide repeat-containing protein At3g57430, chloroplastic-like [Wolffia australiana]